MKKKIIILSTFILVVCLLFVVFSNRNRHLIPEGGTYYVGVTSTDLRKYEGATAIYTAGDKFPKIPQVGDVYVYGGCEYRYNMVCESGPCPPGCYMFDFCIAPYYWVPENQNGWAGIALAESNKFHWELDIERLESINGFPVVRAGSEIR